MSRQNRVTPFGSLIAVPARGTLTGNRGCLHDADGVIRRPYQGKRWIICLLEFKGRRRTIMTPGRYTELFFLDEATALAAGHRPCAECQRQRFEAFRAAWSAGNPGLAAGAHPSAALMDAILHTERAAAAGPTTMYPVRLDQLPDGSMVTMDEDGDAYLVFQHRLLHWSPSGYDNAWRPPADMLVQVLTPRSVVGALAAGFPVMLHETAYAVISR